MEDDTISTPAAQWTHDELERNLSQLSEASFKNRTIVVVYLSLVSIVGFIGNTLVLLVYSIRFKPSAIRIFVLFMAYLDLSTCAIALPLQIYTIRYAYDSDLLSCRSLLAVSTLSTQASGFVLVLVALDRFRRICLPLKTQQNARQALYKSTASVSIAFVIFAPFIPYYGTHHTRIPTSTIEVRMCWSYDKYRHTLYPILYKITVGIAFWAGLAIMVVCYICVGVKVWRQTVQKKGQYKDPRLTISETEMESTSTMSGNFIIAQFKLRKSSRKNNSGTRSRSNLPDQVPDSRFVQSNSKFLDVLNNPNYGDVDSEGVDNASTVSVHEDKCQITSEIEVVADSPQAEQFMTAQSTLQKSPKKDNSGIGSQSTSIHPSSQSYQCSVSHTWFFPTSPIFLEILNVVSAGDDDASQVHFPVSPQLGSSSSSYDSQVFLAQRPADKSSNCNNPNKKSPVTIALPLSHSPTSERETATVRTYSSRIKRKTTLMMCILTMCYIFNWFPHFTARATQTDPVNLCDNYTDCGYNIYALSLRSYYLNATVNIFVYFFCNQQFRLQSGKLYHGFVRRLRARY